MKSLTRMAALEKSCPLDNNSQHRSGAQDMSTLGCRNTTLLSIDRIGSSHLTQKHSSTSPVGTAVAMRCQQHSTCQEDKCCP